MQSAGLEPKPLASHVRNPEQLLPETPTNCHLNEGCIAGTVCLPRASVCLFHLIHDDVGGLFAEIRNGLSDRLNEVLAGHLRFVHSADNLSSPSLPMLANSGLRPSARR